MVKIISAIRLKGCRIYQDIVLVFVLQQLEGEEQDVPGVRLKQVVGRQPLDHLQDEFPDLLDVVLGDEVRRRVMGKGGNFC